VGASPHRSLRLVAGWAAQRLEHGSTESLFDCLMSRVWKRSPILPLSVVDGLTWPIPITTIPVCRCSPQHTMSAPPNIVEKAPGTTSSLLRAPSGECRRSGTWRGSGGYTRMSHLIKAERGVES